MASTEPTTRRQERAKATAEQLLAAARDVFTERGYRATTVGAITARADTAHGTFYLYFKNKDDAFAKVFADAVAELEAESQAPWDGDVRTTLHRAIDGYFGVIERHRGLWRCLMEGSYASPEVEALWLRLRRPFVDRLESVLVGLGTLPGARQLDARATAVALGSMAEWTAYTVVEMDEPTGIGRQRAVDAVADLWYAAVYGPTGAAPA